MKSVEFKYMNLQKAYNKLVEVSDLYDGKNEIANRIVSQYVDAIGELVINLEKW